VEPTGCNAGFGSSLARQIFSQFARMFFRPRFFALLYSNPSNAKLDMEALPVQDQIRAEKKQMQASLGPKEPVEGQLDALRAPVATLPPPVPNVREQSRVTPNFKSARSMLEATLSGKTAREILIRDPDHQRVR
jgi:hypothetical protein